MAASKPQLPTISYLKPTTRLNPYLVLPPLPWVAQPCSNLPKTSSIPWWTLLLVKAVQTVTTKENSLNCFRTLRARKYKSRFREDKLKKIPIAGKNITERDPRLINMPLRASPKIKAPIETAKINASTEIYSKNTIRRTQNLSQSSSVETL